MKMDKYFVIEEFSHSQCAPLIIFFVNVAVVNAAVVNVAVR